MSRQRDRGRFAWRRVCSCSVLFTREFGRGVNRPLSCWRRPKKSAPTKKRRVKKKRAAFLAGVGGCGRLYGSISKRLARNATSASRLYGGFPMVSNDVSLASQVRRVSRVWHVTRHISGLGAACGLVLLAPA